MVKMEQVATTMIRDRLAALGISLAPVTVEKIAPDVMLVARRAVDSSCKDVVRVLAHSAVLKTESDYFREWFMDYDVRMEHDKKQQATVKEMVTRVMRNAEQEGNLREAISGMVQGVMQNVIQQNNEEGQGGQGGELEKHQEPERNAAVTQVEEEPLRYVLIEKLDWTAPVLHAILEWLYTHQCHIDMDELCPVYEAAQRMPLPSLTGAIRDYSHPQYLRHAIDRAEHRDSLLKLSIRAQLSSLRVLCEMLSRSPLSFCMILESANISYRRQSFIPEGLYMLSGHPLCCLKEAESMEPLNNYITLFRESYYRRKKVLSPLRRKSYYESQPAAKLKSGVVWRIMDLGNNPARFCHSFFHYAAERSYKCAQQAGMLIKPVKKESFSLRMVTGSMVSSIIKCALAKAIHNNELKVKEERGSGYYIQSPSYCFSLLLQGSPRMILVGAQAIPHDMVGRAALRIRNPSERTFAKFLPALMSFGVDFEANTMYIIKPLNIIIRILEFAVGLSQEGCCPIEYERHVVEVVEATDPF